HSDYAGNEVYAFNLGTLSWTEVTNPSSTAGGDNNGVLSDGTPVSRHTYDGITFISGTNQMFETSGADAPTGGSDGNAWLFDPTTKTWQKAASNPAISAYGDITQYDPASGHVFEVNNLVGGLQDYNPTTNTWTSHGSQGLADYHMSGAIDPIDHLLVAIGTGHIEAFSLSGSTIGEVTLPNVSGDVSAQKRQCGWFRLGFGRQRVRRMEWWHEPLHPRSA